MTVTSVALLPCQARKLIRVIYLQFLGKTTTRLIALYLWPSQPVSQAGRQSVSQADRHNVMVVVVVVAIMIISNKDINGNGTFVTIAVAFDKDNFKKLIDMMIYVNNIDVGQ